MNRTEKWVPTALLILVTGLSGCATSDFLPKSQWARFDGDDAAQVDQDNYFGQHRIIAVDGHDLYSRDSARVSDEQVDCLRRNCRLLPGTHTVEVAYRWSTLNTEKKRRRGETLGDIGFILMFFFGAASGAGIPDSPSSAHDPIFPCYAALTFEAQVERRYVLYFIDTDSQAPPEEIQIIDSTNGDAISQAQLGC